MAKGFKPISEFKSEQDIIAYFDDLQSKSPSGLAGQAYGKGLSEARSKYLQEFALRNSLNTDDQKSDLQQGLMQQLATMFEANQNRTSELNARQGVGAATESARMRGNAIEQGKLQQSSMMDLDKFFLNFGAQQRQTALDNMFRQQQLDFQKEQHQGSQNDFFDFMAPFIASFAGDVGGYAATNLFGKK